MDGLGGGCADNVLEGDEGKVGDVGGGAIGKLVGGIGGEHGKVVGGQQVVVSKVVIRAMGGC